MSCIKCVANKHVRTHSSGGSLLCDNGDGDDCPNDRCTGSYENTLLCYVSHKMDIVPHEKLVKTVAEFYTDYEIKVAKDLVFKKLAKGKRNIV